MNLNTKIKAPTTVNKGSFNIQRNLMPSNNNNNEMIIDDVYYDSSNLQERDKQHFSSGGNGSIMSKNSNIVRKT